ncbi:MAG TPA: iron ABC transporter permease [Chloroflexota bacterium]
MAGVGVTGQGAEKAAALARPFALPRPSFRVVAGLLLLLGVAVLTLGPVLFVVFGSFDVSKPGELARLGLDAWQQALIESPRTRGAILTSFLLSLRAPLGAVIAFFLAWLIIRTRLPARGLIEFAFWVAFFMPALPVTLGWILLLDPKYGLLNQLLQRLPGVSGPPFDVYSVWGILWIHMTAATVPVMVILLGPAIRQLDASLEESARVCGASPLQLFRKITLPILAPAILVASLAGFIRGLEAFEVEQIIGRPAGIYVYSTRIYDLITWEPPLFPEAMALSTFVLTILVGIAVVYQRTAAGRHYATITGRGMTFRRLTTGPWRYAVAALLLAFLAFTVLLPTAMLVTGSFMKLFGFFTIADPFTPRHWQTVLRDPVFLIAVRNSLVIALGTATAGTLLYAGLAYVLMRSRLAARGITDLLAWLPWTVPGILLGIGLLFVLLSVPALALLYGTVLVMILVLVVKDMPIGTHMMKTSIGQIAPELEHSSQVCGAGGLTTFRRIVLPLMRPMLVSIFVLVFIAALRDISTTILVVTPGTRPLSILMLEYSQSSALESAAVIGVILMALMVVVALLARHFGLRVAAEG